MFVLGFLRLFSKCQAQQAWIEPRPFIKILARALTLSWQLESFLRLVFILYCTVCLEWIKEVKDICYRLNDFFLVARKVRINFEKGYWSKSTCNYTTFTNQLCPIKPKKFWQFLTNQDLRSFLKVIINIGEYSIIIFLCWLKA